MASIPPDSQDASPSPGLGPNSTPAFQAAPRRTAILYGPHGLRAGWSIFLFLGTFLALGLLANLEAHWLIHRFHIPLQQNGEFHPAAMALSEASLLLAVLLATMAMARLEHRRAASYGLAGTGRLRQFLIGLVSGFGFLSILLAVLAGTHHLHLVRSPMGLSRTLGYAAAWGVCFLLVAFTEELLLRGYLLFTLARGIRFWPAAIALAAAFGALHGSNSGESPFGLVAAALVALVFSLSLWRLGHLWWAIGFHATWDWGESFFYGTADSGLVSAGRLMHAHPSGSLLVSGGITGPEGSIWVVPVLILAALFVWFTQPKSSSPSWQDPNRGCRESASHSGQK